MTSQYQSNNQSMGLKAPNSWDLLRRNWGSPDVPAFAMDYNLTGGASPNSDGMGLYSPTQGAGWGGLGSFGLPSSVSPTNSWNSWMPDWMKGAVGNKENPGWGGMAMGAIGGIASIGMGMSQLDLAKKTLRQNKEIFDKNYTVQAGLANDQLEARDNARAASNPTAYANIPKYRVA